MPATPTQAPSARAVLLSTGILVACLLPAFCAVLLGLSALMRDCSGGGSSGSRMTGCELGGISLNWLYELLTPAILLCLVTVPLGIVLCLISLFLPARRAAPPAMPVVEDEVAERVLAALRDLRQGRAARTRCPRCRAVILFGPGDRAPGGGMRINVTCACGACDDSLELEGKAA